VKLGILAEFYGRNKVKVGVLLVNLGTPESPSSRDVFRYLNEFLTDRRVIDLPWLFRQLLVRGIIVPFRYKKSTASYQKIWKSQGSPLKIYGQKLAEGVQKALGEDFRVVLAMRYQQPSISEGLKLLEGCRHLIVLPLFPQYASATTGSVLEKVMSDLCKKEVIPSVTFLTHFFSYPFFIEQFVRNGKRQDIADYDHVLFSFHGLPQSHIHKIDCYNTCLKNGCCDNLCDKNFNCYSAQCYHTAKLIAEKLGLPSSRYTICYQSRLGSDPWLEPYTQEAISSLAKKGAKKLLVFCPSFVADCLETIEEIGEEYAHIFKKLGGDSLHFVKSLNSEPEWIEAVAKFIHGSVPKELLKVEASQLKEVFNG